MDTTGYLYFIIRSEDTKTAEDTIIFVKIGMTKDPRSRITNYITHHVGDSPPVYYKIWRVRDEKLEETLALAHFDQRVVKTGSTMQSEVVRATKAQIEAYVPRDPQRVAIAPHTMMPAETYVARYDVAQRFEEHWEELRVIQMPVIGAIAAFFRDPDVLARKLRAPCGTGKTHMTCEAIRLAAADNQAFKVCIICPTRLIADQWRGNLYRLGVHAPILTKSDLQTKDGQQREDQTGCRFRIITYSSCSAVRADPSWTFVFDEAHHTCGVVTENAGMTKRLVNEAVAAKCHRLFLTFTPKNCSRATGDPKDASLSYLNSMDDPDVYGDDVSFPDMRSLVDRGLMPDYRLILTYRDHEKTLATVGDFKDSNRIIVCSQNVNGENSIETAAAFLRTTKSNVFIAHGGMTDEQVAESISGFSSQTGKSWLLTCLVLLEGADVPAADTVVLLAPWRTETRLIQLLLRPGRWYPKKPTFNIVAPSDADGNIEANLRIAGFDVVPKKVRHLRPAGDSSSATSDMVHVWAVSYTDKNSVEGGLTPGKSDFDAAIANSQITAVQNGLDKAKAGDLVILRGPNRVAFATITAVRSLIVAAGSKKTRTVMDVVYMSIPGGLSSKDGKLPILITTDKYREVIIALFDGREDRDWIGNPRFTGANKYDKERHQLIAHILGSA